MTVRRNTATARVSPPSSEVRPLGRRSGGGSPLSVPPTTSRSLSDYVTTTLSSVALRNVPQTGTVTTSGLPKSC